jgi:hypothetical protein
MAENDEIFRKVAEYLSNVTGPDRRVSPITRDTEVYRDLGIYGDDVFELVLWINREFGSMPPFELSRFAPGETSLLSRMVRKVLGLKESQYQSLTVGEVVAAIEGKSWP